MRSGKILAGVAAAALLAGCADNRTDGTGLTGGEVVGGLTGAVAGGLVGSQIGSGTGRTIATAAGAALGGFIGSQIGQELDAPTQQSLESATVQALETGQPQSWRSANASGVVTPSPAYYVGGRECRQFTTTVSYRGGAAQSTASSACKLANGNWQLQA